MALRHHDLCFGCGQANLFGLQVELERLADGSVEGRFFVKQDHQGPPGFAHGGVLAAALDETAALVAAQDGRPGITARLEIDLRAPAPIGAFVSLRGRIERQEGEKAWVTATAAGEDGAELGVARALLVRQ